MGLAIGALIWGFAEATLFFIVPDVLLSRVAMSNFRKAHTLCLYALLGAMMGGSLLYFLALSYPLPVSKIIQQIPGIHPGLIDRTFSALLNKGSAAIFLGGFQGIPFKLNVMGGAQMGLPFYEFFLMGIIARYARFLMVCAVGWGFSKMFLSARTEKIKTLLHIFIWIGFYIYYFSSMSARYGG